MTPEVAKRLKEITVDPKTVKSTSLNTTTAPAVDLSGKWLFTINAGGQSHVVRIEITQNGSTFTGKSESDLGAGTIVDGKVAGRDFTAILRAEIQGQTIDIAIEGSLETDGMKGQFSSPVIGNLPFTASRDN